MALWRSELEVLGLGTVGSSLSGLIGIADALGMEDISGDELVDALTRSGAGMSVYSKIGGVVVLIVSENHKLLYICMLKGWRSGLGRGA